MGQFIFLIYVHLIINTSNYVFPLTWLAQRSRLPQPPRPHPPSLWGRMSKEVERGCCSGGFACEERIFLVPPPPSRNYYKNVLSAQFQSRRDSRVQMRFKFRFHMLMLIFYKIHNSPDAIPEVICDSRV